MESKRSGFGFLCRESMMPQLKLARAIQCKTSSLSGAFELDHVGDLCKGRLEHTLVAYSILQLCLFMACVCVCEFASAGWHGLSWTKLKHNLGRIHCPAKCGKDRQTPTKHLSGTKVCLFGAGWWHHGIR